MKVQTLIPFVLAATLAACGSDSDSGSDSSGVPSGFTAVDEVELNDTAQDAQVVSLQSVISGSLIAGSDLQDLFSVAITEATDVTITLTGDEGTNFDVGLYQGANQLAGSGGETSEEEITHSITSAGTYFVGVVVGDDSSMGDYTLTIGGVAFSESDNSGDAVTYFGPVINPGVGQVLYACNEFTKASYDLNVAPTAAAGFYNVGTCEADGGLTIIGSCLNKEGNTRYYSAEADVNAVCPE